MKPFPQGPPWETKCLFSGKISLLNEPTSMFPGTPRGTSVSPLATGIFAQGPGQYQGVAPDQHPLDDNALSDSPRRFIDERALCTKWSTA